MAEPVQARVDVPRAIREAAIAGLVTFGILLPLIGLQTTVNIRNELILNPRPLLLAVMVACIVAISLLQSLVFQPLAARRAAYRTEGASIRSAHRRAQFAKVAIPFALGFAFLFPIIVVWFSGLQGSTKWIDNFGIQILIYIMLGLGLNIVVGLAGLLDLGYVAFYAVGAYSYALLAKTFGFSFWMLLPLAGILSAFWGILLGFPVLRLRGDYLAIVTLAFGEIIHILLKNLGPLTGGPNGLTGIPRASFFGIPFNNEPNGFAAIFGLEFNPAHRTVFLFYVIFVLALITNWVSIRLRRLPIGRAWEALREDEIACRSLGINTTNTKLTAFAIGAMFGGFAGSFFAARQGFISPDSFTFPESALILAIVVLGGMGSQLGVAIAAAVMIGGFELFREFAQFRMIIFGFAMVAIMVWRPRGLVSSRNPTVYLAERRTIGAVHVAEGRG